MIKKFLLTITAVIAIAITALYLTGHGYIMTAISRTYLKGHPTANIDDHPYFDTRRINAADPQPWPLHPAQIGDALPEALVQHMADNQAVAFLVIHEGKLFAERYVAPYDDRSRTNSFSMAKTVVTMLLGLAIEDGYIDSLDQPLIELLPEFADDPKAQQATIGSLSTMTSGFDWDEHYYSPFSPTVALLYSNNVGRFLLKRSFSHDPEEHFYYSSASTQLLAMSIERALTKNDPSLTLSEYLSRKLWQPLGMNDAALWHLDGTGMELGYCCLNTNARNYAKLGQLMLQGGAWNGEQLIPAAFAERMRTSKAVPYYGYSTWINPQHEPKFYSFRGHLGQYIVVVPEHDLVIVRLGHQHPQTPDGMFSILPKYVDWVVPLLPAPVVGENQPD